MAYDLKVRQELNNRGITNDQIGYNQSTGYVTVGGQNFLQPQKNFQGTTFTDQPTFNQAWSAYERSLQQPAQQNVQQALSIPQDMFTPTHQGVGWQDALANYAQNPQLAQTELQRAQQVMNYHTAIGNAKEAQAAQHWINQLNQVMGVNPNANPADRQVQDLMQSMMEQSRPQTNPQDAQIQQLINSLLQQASNRQTFDPYASPEFAAQEERSQRAAQEGIRAAQEALGSAGFGRSTALAERAQGIQNDQEDFLRTQVIPQIIAQNEQRRQQELQNQMALLNPLMQQQGLFDDRQQQTLQNQMALLNPLLQQQGVFDDRARFDQQFEYQAARDAIADERYRQEFDEDVRRFGLQFAQDKAMQQGQLNVARMNAETSRRNADTSAGQLQLGRDRFDFETNPENQRVEVNTNEIESQIIEQLFQAPDLETANNWIASNAAYITQALGSDAVTKMRKFAEDQYGTGDNKAQQDIRNRAVSMAQNDVFRWNQANTPEAKEALIREYEKLLRVQ